MSYSRCDFVDSILTALKLDDKIQPEYADNPAQQADFAVKAIDDLQDLARNVAGLDLYAVAHMTPDALRSTLLEYRDQAQKLVS
jgi:hypothetical protein